MDKWQQNIISIERRKKAAEVEKRTYVGPEITEEQAKLMLHDVKKQFFILRYKTNDQGLVEKKLMTQ